MDGRGAWTTRGKLNRLGNYARIPGRPRDGTIPDPIPDGTNRSWYESVHHGVAAIQHLLIREGYTLDVTGVYGRKTRQAVRAFQDRTAGLTDTGIVGGFTMGELIRPVVRSAAQSRGVHPRWLFGLARQESAFDPGAQGWTTPDDLGLWQFNTQDGTPPPDHAFDPGWSAFAVAARFADACERYGSQETPHHRMIDCAIIQHRSPVAADYLFNEGEPYGPESAEYVENVRAFAKAW